MSSDRRRRFRERTSFERSVLKQVNSTLGVPDLSGISAAAIKLWTEEQKNHHPHGIDQQLVAQLLVLSDHAKALADRSSDVFDSQPLPQAELKRELKKLGRLLAESTLATPVQPRTNS